MVGFGGAVAVMLMMVLFAAPSLGTFVVEENSLTVSTPDSLKGTYQSSIGNFGVPQYGGTLTGYVKYPGVNAKACEKFPDGFFRAVSGARPYFALVDRGGNLPSLSNLPFPPSPTGQETSATSHGL